MAYTPLYTEYRPKDWDSVVGQEAVVKTLRNAIEQDKVAHAYILSGNRGLGKTTLAKIFAKALNCESDNPPCNECHTCRAINDMKSMDYTELDAASNRGVDTVRDMIINKVQFRPRGKYKLFVIDECHMLTVEAWNALLKTLESPPEHCIFIFATTELHKVLPTIISRCQVFKLNDMTIENIVGRLEFICEDKEFEYEQEALELIARHARGGMRDAISSLDQISSLGEEITIDLVQESLGVLDFLTVSEYFEAIIEKDNKAFDIITKVSNPINFLEQIIVATQISALLGRKIKPKEVSKLLNISIQDVELIKPISEKTLTQMLDSLTNFKFKIQTSLDANSLLISLTMKLTSLGQEVKEVKLIEKEIEEPNRIDTIPIWKKNTEKVDEESTTHASALERLAKKRKR